MTRDIHSDAVELETDLRRRGDQRSADRIDVAIAGGATGTESLVRLGTELRRLGKRRSGLDRDLRKRARRIARAIDAQLKRV